MSTLANYVIVESPEHFQQELSKDLERVSVLYFRATWAEPCKTMDGVTEELAKRWSNVLFLSVSPLAILLTCWWRCRPKQDDDIRTSLADC